MRRRLMHRFLAPWLVLSCLMLVAQAWAINVTINTFKDSSVFSFDPFTPDPFNIELDASTSDMSYIAFDVGSIAVDEGVPPSQIQLNSVTFHIVDWRTNRNGTNILYLADVPADWDEANITWIDAVNGYGATGGPGAADLDSSKELWEGRLNFGSTTVVEVAATSEPPYTDADMVSAIQTDLTNGDGKAVFVMRGTLGSNLYAAAKENDESLTPPRLMIDYTVIGAGLAGDFNSDSAVNAADYVLWRKNDGTNNILENDGGLGTPIDERHYNLWKTNFGMPGPGSGGNVVNSAIPEPTVCSMLAFAVGSLVCSRGRRAARHPAQHL
ncbi:MAG: hypothetical protein WD738_06765 [Pirellulales bacterium]